MDHCEITTPTGERIIVLIVLDGATTLLTSSPVSSKSEPESIKIFREYVDQYQLQPKYVVADQAFMTPEWERICQILNIRPVSLGPMTPWPNLFKKQVKVVLQSIHDRSAPASLHAVSYRQLLREAALARNTSIIYGGVTPLELAFGRRPADIVQLDTALPSQLSHDPRPDEDTTIQLRDLARKSYIEARQSEDVRRDLAGQFRMSNKLIAPQNK